MEQANSETGHHTLVETHVAAQVPSDRSNSGRLNGNVSSGAMHLHDGTAHIM